MRTFQRGNQRESFLFFNFTHYLLKPLYEFGGIIYENRKQSVYNYDFSLHETKEVPDLEGNFANLQKYIFELEEIDRIIIGLYLEDLTQLKIADIVGLSHGNIRVKIHRIKENLAKKMKTNE